MERHLSAQLIYPHHVSKWVVLVMARVMAYLTARVLVIRSFVRQAACTACWFLLRHSGEEKHLARKIFNPTWLVAVKLELWTSQPCLALEGGVARGNLVLSLASNKKEALFKWNFTAARFCGYIFLCVSKKTETERLTNTAPLRNIKLKNGEQTPSTGGSLQKHHSRSFASKQNRHIQTHSEGKHWFKMLILNNFTIHNAVQHKVFVCQFPPHLMN